ncbi:molybdopterin-guanine dinucleotide biosynthesis protein B [Dethiosulfatarculus sandiegensis]|uniref:Molybdopterin-guanine dinucleotide biosynthesis protein B n=1 Tax=Dethiosulfatarculus sandiegensis TaxID=1429043 RepID=A0A0D2GI99_9BACT|nr:molybdopterin-guanine dinucleotide biosynthesis protein B [Dethiosulfatarculus sandiegensis]KIX14542.1 molybdopterin-guanine dinucleotide biosynthesis protein B [Dethiosulfatarculus sandiegensis]
MLPLLGFCGFSNSGKTTLVSAVVRELTAYGLKVAVIKHHGHPEGLIRPEELKDTDKFSRAGAESVALVHEKGILLETRSDPKDLAPALVAAKYFKDHDFVLVEGFKKASIPKIEVVAPGKEPHLLGEKTLLALARRAPLEKSFQGLPVLDADQPVMVAKFILKAFPGLIEKITRAGQKP